MKQQIRRMVGNAVRRTGWDLVLNELSTNGKAVVARTVPLAGEIRTVIDVGASNGMWTADLLSVLPDAEFLLFEAADPWYDELRRFEAANARVSVEYAAASDHEGEVFFRLDPANPLGGGAASESDQAHTASVPCLPIDVAVERRGLQGPFLLKLDTQGHEIDVLAGAERVLKETALVVMEVYGIPRAGRPAFDEISHHMKDLGFRLAGIADVLHRPIDGMFWQADAHFLPETHQVFGDPTFPVPVGTRLR